MDKSEKQVSVNALHDKMAKATFAAAVSFNKLDAFTAIELRRTMRAAKVDYKVVKNTLALLAAKGTAVEKLSPYFEGPVAIVLGYGDVVATAKTISDFFKKSSEKLKVKGAIVEGAPVDAKGVEALAKLPGLPELRATLLAMINTPATTLVRLIGTPGGQLARVINAHAEASGEKAA